MEHSYYYKWEKEQLAIWQNKARLQSKAANPQLVSLQVTVAALRLLQPI